MASHPDDPGEGSGPRPIGDVVRGLDAVRARLAAVEDVDMGATPPASDSIAEAVEPEAPASQPRRRSRSRASTKPRPDVPFRNHDGELQYGLDQEGADGAKERRWVPVGSELRALGWTRTGENEDWGLLLEVVDRDGELHPWAMPWAMLAGSGEAARARLMALGWRPHRASGPKWRDRLTEYLLGIDPEERVRCVPTVGWHRVPRSTGDGTALIFAFPEDAVTGEDVAERVVLQTAEPLNHAFREAGTLEEWQREVGGLAVGNSRLLLALSAAFAAPLLELLGESGFLIHLRGGSSSGKSTALLLAGSAWGGGGSQGYGLTWRTTDNAGEATFAMHNAALLCLDELGQVDPKAAGAVAYMLAQGQGKARLGREGQVRRTFAWRLVGLSSGEIALADKIAEGGGRIAAGQGVRVLDVRADASQGMGLFEDLHGGDDPGAFSQRIKAGASRYYGTAARTFLRALLADLDGALARVAHHRRTILAVLPEEADGQVKRVAGAFALVGAAGELAAELGVVPWDLGEATEGARRCFVEWLAERGGSDAAEVIDAAARLRRAVEVDGHSRFLPWRHDPRVVVRTNSLGYLRTAEDGGKREDDDPPAVPTYFLHKSGMDELLRGLDQKAVLRDLANRKVIVRQAVTEKGLPVQALSRTYHVPSENRSIRLFELNLTALMSGADHS